MGILLPGPYSGACLPERLCDFSQSPRLQSGDQNPHHFGQSGPRLSGSQDLNRSGDRIGCRPQSLGFSAGKPLPFLLRYRLGPVRFNCGPALSAIPGLSPFWKVEKLRVDPSPGNFLQANRASHFAGGARLFAGKISPPCDPLFSCLFCWPPPLQRGTFLDIGLGSHSDLSGLECAFRRGRRHVLDVLLRVPERFLSIARPVVAPGSGLGASSGNCDLALKPGNSGFVDLIKKSTALILVFFLTRAGFPSLIVF